MNARLLPLALATTTLVVPAVALAQVPSSTTPAATAPTTPAATTPAAPAAPAKAPKAKLALVAQGLPKTGMVLVGSKVRLRGVVRPYVAGQKVTVRITQNDKRVKQITRTVLKSSTGSAGTFLIAYKPKSSGPMSVTASHLRTAQLGAAAARPVAVDVLPRAVPQGSEGLAVRVMQRHLKALGYVTGDPGKYDGHTIRAVVAFRKQTGMDRIASADKPFFKKLASGAGAFKVRYPSHGRHVEGDLTHQTMALIGAGGKVERIYPISSGKPSTPTVLGTYRIYRKDYGTNAKGMVDASYFYNGYAIHGYAEVPTYAASHGCLRTPVPDARSISDWVRHGTIVDVYYR